MTARADGARTREDDPVPKFVMAVYSNAKPGREAEYLDWYKNVHLGDILKIPGVKTGHVYETAPASPAKPASYMALYDLELDEPATVLQEIGRASQAGEMKMTDAIDAASAQITIWKQNF
jgi:hypothetical protein